MVFASKAFPCTAIYRLMAAQGIGVDVAGAGELVMALASGVDPARVVMHGNAKTTAELQMAVDAGVGLIVIDNTDDIDRLEGLVRSEQPVLIRVIPGVRPDTHEAVATGQLGSKFGLPIPAARSAIARLRHSSKLRLDGLHMHIGSQILQAEPYARRSRPSPGWAGSRPTTWAAASGCATPTTTTRPLRRTGSRPWRARRAAICPTARRSSSSRAEPDRPVRGDPVPGDFGEGRRSPFRGRGRGMADNMEVALYGQRFEAAVASRVAAAPRWSWSDDTANPATS